MRCIDANEVPPGEVCEIGAKGVQVQWLLAQPEGAPNFALRRFTLEPNGQTPLHSHPWEHEVYVLQGGGAAVMRVNRYFSSGEENKIFTGKWYTHILSGDIDDLASGQGYQKNGLGDRLVSCIAARLDFRAEWADGLRRPVREVAALILNTN